MKWFSNLKISTKLLSAVLLIALITAFIGYMGYNAMLTMKQAENDVGNICLPSVESLLIISQAQTAVDDNENALLVEELQGEGRKELYDGITAAFGRAEEAMKTFESIPQSSEEKGLWGEFTSAWQRWKQDDAQFVKLSR